MVVEVGYIGLIGPGCEALHFIACNIEEIVRCKVTVINSIDQIPTVKREPLPLINYLKDNNFEKDYEMAKAATMIHVSTKSDFIGGRQNKYGKKFIR